MTPAQRDLIDHNHRQKYLNSCPASLCEMLLKFEGAIAVDFTEFQDAAPNGTEGVSRFVNLRLPQNYTLRRMRQGKSWELPLAEIKAKLAANIPVGIYLNPDNAPAHGWLVDRIRVNAAGVEEIVLVSKYSELGKDEGKKTVEKIVPVTDSSLRWSDPIYPEKLAES